LVYHGVLPAPIRRIHARFVSTDQLCEQVGYFRKHFQLISLDQAFAGDFDPQRMAIALTFDDGYRNNFEYALPILKQFNAPATFFVASAAAFGDDILWPDALDLITATQDRPLSIQGQQFHKNRKSEYVDSAGKRLKSYCKEGGLAYLQFLKAALGEQDFRKDPTWNGYWQLMDAQMLRALAQEPGMSIGGHSSRHSNLDRMPLSDALSDVQIGLDWLSAAIGKPIRSFAFPDGAYSPELVHALSQLGMQQQLLSEYRFNDETDQRLRDRFTIHPYLATKVAIAELLRGTYS
jgi:peptidoglycan/xylan/chitin deacetylase (PgdA/CDA1 family)